MEPRYRWRRGAVLALAVVSLVCGCLHRHTALREDRPRLPGSIGRVDLGRTASAARRGISGGAPGITEFTWQCGDRRIPLAGRALIAGGTPLAFAFRVPAVHGPLTLELREFRTTDDGRVAYLVEANGQRLQFRNRRYEGASPSSAFVDIPEALNGQGTLAIRLTNLCENPICFSAAILYDDLEGYARREGLLQPLYIGPVIDPYLHDDAKLRRVRALLPDTAEVKPLFSFGDLAVAHWSPETQAATLERVLAVARMLEVKFEIQATSWWASTPRGCDGRGGRWDDVTYQQVTYVPSTGEFGLSIPNCWSNTPWLTVGNQRLNSFKANSFAQFGQMLRAAYDRDPLAFPVLAIVVENEPVYWVEGNPGAAVGQVADFNPALVGRAREQGITLDPRDGLSRPEKEFLQAAIRNYNREMTDGLRRGLGAGAPAERVFTGTFIRLQGDIFANLLEATSVGVLEEVRLGGAEWEAKRENLALLEQHRELGVPGATNVFYGHNPPVAFDLQFAYATGCDHFTCFGASESSLAEIGAALRGGWQELKPLPWRKLLFTVNQFRRGTSSLAEYFAESRGVVVEPWPLGAFDIHAEKAGQSGFATMHFDSRKLRQQPVFAELVLAFEARAFTWDLAKSLLLSSPDSYLAVRAGVRPDQLTEVARRFDVGVPTVTRIELTALAKGAPELWVEFEFHALGLADWVSLFDVALEQPWPDENLLFTNRSYRADRLRCESLVSGWRADAEWALMQAEREAATGAAGAPDRAALAAARAQFRDGAYRTACQTARALRDHRAPAPTVRPWAPPADRAEQGELAAADSAHVRFDPYQAGYCSAVVKLGPNVAVSLEVNGQLRSQVSVSDLLPGDDVTIEVRGNLAVSLSARRGTATGTVTTCTAMTPFALPRLAIEGQPERSLAYTAEIATGVAFSGWQVGYRPVAEGATVHLRWNPETSRIVHLGAGAP